MYTVVREIERPPREAVEALSSIATAVLSDTLGRFATMDAGIKPLAEGMHVVGPAVTVKTYPADNLMIHLALKVARRGDVLVVDADSVTDTAVIGELVALCAKTQGIGGLVVDGSVRDKMGIRALAWPVFVRGVVPNGPLKNGPGSINVPISCGGLVVNPGDIVVADDDGVVVVPRERWQEVAQAAQAIEAREQASRARIEAGEVMWDMQGLEKNLAAYKVEWR